MEKIISIVLLLSLALTTPTAEAQRSHSTIKVIFNRTKNNGKAWDVWGGQPDPYIVIDGYSFLAYGCMDTYACTFVTNKKGVLTIDVWDADAKNDDYAGTVTCRPGYRCTTGRGATVIVH